MKFTKLHCTVYNKHNLLRVVMDSRKKRLFCCCTSESGYCCPPSSHLDIVQARFALNCGAFRSQRLTHIPICRSCVYISVQRYCDNIRLSTCLKGSAIQLNCIRREVAFGCCLSWPRGMWIPSLRPQLNYESLTRYFNTPAYLSITDSFTRKSGVWKKGFIYWATQVAKYYLAIPFLYMEFVRKLTKSYFLIEDHWYLVPRPNTLLKCRQQILQVNT